MEQNISALPLKTGADSAPANRNSSQTPSASSGNVVNLGMYKLKKSLQREGFEIVEDQKGKITLVVRVSK